MTPKKYDMTSGGKLGGHIWMGVEDDGKYYKIAEVEQLLRKMLKGHPSSELWGNDGLIAATMRKCDAYDELEEKAQIEKAFCRKERNDAEKKCELAVDALEIVKSVYRNAGTIDNWTMSIVRERLKQIEDIK